MSLKRCKTLGLATALVALPALPALAGEEDRSGYFQLPGTGTQLKVYGTVQVYAQYCFNQFLYDNGPLLGGDTDARDASKTPDKQFSMTARTSLFGFKTITPSAALGDIKTQLEVAFNAGDPGPKGNPKLSLAAIEAGRWLVGYTFSNWLDLEAAPETVDSSGPIGQSCNDTGKYTQVRYKLPLDQRSSLAFSVETSQLAHKKFGAADNPNPLKPDGTHESTIQPDARYPSLVAGYTFAESWGHLGVRLLGQNYGAYQPATSTTGAVRPNRWAGAVQLSGNCKFGQDNLVASVYTGSGVGTYGFNPQAARFVLAEDRVLLYRCTGWQAGYTHHWNERLRSNLIATGLYFRNDPEVVQDRDVKRSENYFLNSIVKLSKTFELGMEYGYERLKTFGAGAVVRRDGSTGDSNRSNKVQLTLTARF